MKTLYESILSSTGSGISAYKHWKDIIDLIAEKLQQLIKSNKIRFSGDDYLSNGNPGYKFEIIELSTKLIDIENVLFSKNVKDKIRFADRSIMFREGKSTDYRYFLFWTTDDVNYKIGFELFYGYKVNYIQFFMFDVQQQYISKIVKDYFISKMKQFEK